MNDPETRILVEKARHGLATPEEQRQLTGEMAHCFAQQQLKLDSAIVKLDRIEAHLWKLLWACFSLIAALAGLRVSDVITH